MKKIEKILDKKVVTDKVWCNRVFGHLRVYRDLVLEYYVRYNDGTIGHFYKHPYNGPIKM